MYTVIFPSGKVLTFSNGAIAKTYATAYRGCLITPQILNTLQRIQNV